MKMDKRYEKYNELMFTLYSMSSVDNGINKEKQRKNARSNWQLSMSVLTDSVLCALAGDSGIEHLHEESYHTFNVHGVDVPVYSERLAKAILYLLPRDRDIILLYYFLGMTDERIAKSMGMKLPTVNYRRKVAREKLRSFLEDTK